MAPSQMGDFLRHLRRAVLLRDGAGLTDGQLLGDYLSRHDEAALVQPGVVTAVRVTRRDDRQLIGVRA